MSLIILVVVTAIFICLIPRVLQYAFLIKRHLEYGRKLPGPPALPFIGNAHQLALLDSSEVMLYLITESKRLLSRGNSVMRIWVADRLHVFPLNGETAKDIVDSSVEIHKGADYDFLIPWLGTGLLISTGEKWRSRRKLLTPTFHFAHLDGYLDIFNRESKILIDVLKVNCGQECVDLFPYIKRCALDIICSTAMGKILSAQTNPLHPYVVAVTDMNHMAHAYFFKPWLWFYPIWYLSGWDSAYKKTLKILTDFTKEVIAERKTSYDKNENNALSNRKAFLDMLLDMKKMNHLTDEDIREEVDTFMFEGHDTTSSGVAWILWCLACHPEHQNRVAEELYEVFGASNRNMTVDDIKKLPYMDRCIKEAMRMYPPVPLVQRNLQNDLKMGNYLLPAGSQVNISPIILHYNEEVYPDPHYYNPDRFLPENISKRHAYDYIPFSAGLRNCIGQKFALYEEKVMVSWLLRRFSLSSPLPFHNNGRCIELVLRPYRGIPLKITERTWH